MITQKTSADIWSAYREIEAAEKLLSEVERERPFGDRDKHAPTLKLGIPSGDSAHRIYDVAPP